MTKMTPISPDKIFVPPGTPSFADLIETLTTQGELFPSRQRDMISGLRRVAEALGLPPGDVPADPAWLRPRLPKLSPALIGLTTKTWQNIRSNARAAMVECGLVERRFRRITDLGPEWRLLWQAVLDLNDPTLSFSLCRFVHYLDRTATTPAAVTLADAEAFRDAVALNEISKDPERTFRASIDGWNLAVRRVPGWPQNRLEAPSRQKRIALPRGAFPPGFITDLDALMIRLATPDPFADESRERALRPDTIRQYRRLLMRFASEVVASGHDASALTAITDVLTPAVAERGLRHMLGRTGNETTVNIAETATLLRNFGRLVGVPETEQAALDGLARKLRTPHRKGMTAKNRSRLRLLQQPSHRSRVLCLPERIFARPANGRKAHTVALAREDALAIAILLHCPIRVKNLANLTIGRHVQRPGDGRVFIVLEEEDTKTGRSIEFELPPDVIRMLDAHLETRVPYLCPAGTIYLFPQRSGGRAIDPSCLATRIAKRVRTETGLAMNAHLFRHFAVMNWLDANPGGYEVARRLLGHSELSHTINMYSGLEVTSATRAFSDLVGRMQGEAR